MKSLENVKAELQRGIEKLPEHKIPEVLQFVNLKKREVLKEREPLANFIGAVECGSLAQNIDAELYGE